MLEDDLRLVATWLAEEHVQRWWRDPPAPLRVEEKYRPRLLGAEPTEMFVILHAGEPIGLIQRYLMRDHPDWVRSLQPSGQVFEEAAGIDYAIGRAPATSFGGPVGWTRMIRATRDQQRCTYCPVSGALRHGRKCREHHEEAMFRATSIRR